MAGAKMEGVRGAAMSVLGPSDGEAGGVAGMFKRVTAVWDQNDDDEFREEAEGSTLKKDLVKASAKNKK